MPLRNAPYDVNRPTVVIRLQHQYGRPLSEGRVVFNHDGCCDTAQNISNENSVGSQLVITVLGNTNIVDCDEFFDPG